METITDLAYELLRRAPRTTSGIEVTTTAQAGITIHTTTITTTTAARLIGKPIGTYLNLDTTNGKPRNIVNALQQALAPFIT